MAEAELKKRTKPLALRVMKLVDALPKSLSARVIANQLIRSGTSVGANYRSACRGGRKPNSQPNSAWWSKRRTSRPTGSNSSWRAD